MLNAAGTVGVRIAQEVLRDSDIRGLEQREALQDQERNVRRLGKVHEL